MAVSVDRVVLNPQYGSNCSVISASGEAPEAAVVDPGRPSARAAHSGGSGSVAGILVTHTDIDHVAGVAKAWYPDRRGGLGAGG